MVEPIFEKVNISQRIGDVVERIKVECKTDVSSDAINGILSVSPWVIMDETVVEEGKIKYSGRINFYVAFVDADGDIKKCECGNEFSGEIKDGKISDVCKASIVTMVEKTESETSGVYLSVSAYLAVKAEITDCTETSALVGGEDLVVKESEIVQQKSFGVRKGGYPLEDEFEVDYPVGEVLYHRCDAFITAVQSGVGCIIVDGEVLFSAIMLQKNGKNDIIRENRVLPFRMEIECEDSMPNMRAVARVKEKSFKIDVAVDDDGGKSVVTISVNLSFEGEVFTETSLVVASDAFSTENQVEIIKGCCPFYKMSEPRSYTAVVSGRAQTSELSVGATMLAVGGEKALILSEECSEKGFSITGILCATAYLKDGDGKVFTRKLETPFEKIFEGDYSCGTIIDKVVKAGKAKAKIISLTEIDLEAEIYLNVYPQEKSEYNVVKEIKVLGAKEKSSAGISVYIATEGEELWSLAKRLSVCPEALIATNKDLQFPLSGKERIVVYRKK